VTPSGTAVPIPLNVGTNTVNVDLKAEDGTTTKNYTITIKRSAAALATTSLIVNESELVVNIPLKRMSDTGPVLLQISTTSVFASAGQDYDPPTPNPIDFHWTDGTLTKNFPITIKDPPNTDEPNENFLVTIGGEEMAVAETVNVLILNSVDNTVPGVTASNPSAGEVLDLPTGATEELVGLASDNKGVKEVKVSLNGASAVNAAMNPTGDQSPLNSTYSLVLAPRTGANTLQIQAFDHLGKSTILTRNFTVRRPLVVDVNAEFGSVTAGFGVVGGSYREVGKSFTITATPKTGKIFTGWTVLGDDIANGGVDFVPSRLGIAATALEKPALTFIFREGLLLSANFMDNPYDDGEVAGTYTGLIKASPDLPDRPTGTDGSVPGVGTEGYFTASVMTTGAFSGKVTIDGFVLNVAGTFDHQGRARFGTTRAFTQTVARTNKPSLIVKFDIGGPPLSVVPTPGKITGRVTALEFQKSSIASVSTVEAERAHFTGLTLDKTVPDSYLTVTGTAASPKGRTDGVFTVVLPSVPLTSQPDRIEAVFTEQDYPQGDGVGTIRVTKAGAVTLSATLADGTAVTGSGSLSQDLNAALFAQLYNLKGFFSAPVTLNSTQADSDLKKTAAGEVLWSRPFNNKSHYYPYGWAETLELDLLGARYVATAGKSIMRAPNGAFLQNPDGDGNVVMSLIDGQLPLGGLVKSANLSTMDIVTRVPDNDPTFTMLVTRSTGIISGVFDHTDDTKPAYKAAVFQKGPNAGAYGYFLTKQPTPIDYTGQSGGVTIIGEP
jgi:hypothetical protein